MTPKTQSMVGTIICVTMVVAPLWLAGVNNNPWWLLLYTLLVFIW